MTSFYFFLKFYNKSIDRCTQWVYYNVIRNRKYLIRKDDKYDEKNYIFSRK